MNIHDHPVNGFHGDTNWERGSLAMCDGGVVGKILSMCLSCGQVAEDSERLWHFGSMTPLT